MLYFLISYDIIDREDLNTNQKMIAIYLARKFDEKKYNATISPEEIAKSLKLSIDEVNISLDILSKKNIINRGSRISELELFQFNDFTLQKGDVVKTISRIFGFPVSGKTAKLIYTLSGEDYDKIKSAVEQAGEDDPIEDVFMILQNREQDETEPEKANTTSTIENPSSDSLSSSFDILEKSTKPETKSKAAVKQSAERRKVPNTRYMRAQKVYGKGKSETKGSKNDI